MMSAPRSPQHNRLLALEEQIKGQRQHSRSAVGAGRQRPVALHSEGVPSPYRASHLAAYLKAPAASSKRKTSARQFFAGETSAFSSLRTPRPPRPSAATPKNTTKPITKPTSVKPPRPFPVTAPTPGEAATSYRQLAAQLGKHPRLSSPKTHGPQTHGPQTRRPQTHRSQTHRPQTHRLENDLPAIPTPISQKVVQSFSKPLPKLPIRQWRRAIALPGKTIAALPAASTPIPDLPVASTPATSIPAAPSHKPNWKSLAMTIRQAKSKRPGTSPKPQKIETSTQKIKEIEDNAPPTALTIDVNYAVLPSEENAAENPPKTQDDNAPPWYRFRH